jgi:hypothetical protein
MDDTIADCPEILHKLIKLIIFQFLIHLILFMKLFKIWKVEDNNSE